MGDVRNAFVYPTSDQYARWQERADELDKSVSEFIIAMTEAGIKELDGLVIDLDDSHDESYLELRRERNSLKRELRRARERIQELEDLSYREERRALRRYVEDNPGASYDEMTDFLRRTVPQRMQLYTQDLYAEVDEDGEHMGWFAEEDPTDG